MRKSWFIVLAVSFFICAIDVVQAADEYTVELYQTYCQACHLNAGANVPVAFDEDDWQQRLKKVGLDTLVNNAIIGKGNMPAQGSCMECTYEDLLDIVNYMSVAKDDLAN